MRIASQRYEQGTRDLAGFAVPLDVTQLKVAMSREFWVEGVRGLVKGEVFVSFDGGSKFEFLCGFEAEGGTVRKKDGTESTETDIRFSVPQPKNANRIVKLRLDTKAPIDSEITIDEDVKEGR